MGGARPLTPRGRGGRGAALGRPPQAGTAQNKDRKAFLDPHPRQAQRGLGGPGRGGSATARWRPRRLDAVRARGAGSPARTGPVDPRLHSRRTRLPAARPARGGGAKTAGQAAGTSQEPPPGGGGPQTPVGGTTSEPPGSGGRRSRFEVGGRGEAWPPLISARSPPQSDLDGPAAGSGCERQRGGRICMSLACDLHSPQAPCPASRFGRPAILGPQEWEGER